MLLINFIVCILFVYTWLKINMSQEKEIRLSLREESSEDVSD